MKQDTICINSRGQHDRLTNGNQILGEMPSLDNSKIVFCGGSNNILFCEKNIKLVNSTLSFCGDNSIIYLGSNRYEYKLKVTAFNNVVFHMGRNNYINDTLNVVLSEEKHIFIGDNNFFSLGVWIRNADPHLIYASKSMSRINLTKSIFIGDHVWVGQNVMILKGTQIGSGSIIGAMSVAAGKIIPSNTIWAGNPIKMVKSEVFWDGACVHQWTQEQTKKSIQYKDDEFIYPYDECDNLAFDTIDDKLTNQTTESKLEYLMEIREKKKNRFALR